MGAELSPEYLFGRVDKLTAENAAVVARVNTINGSMKRNADELVRLREEVVARDETRGMQLADLRVDVARHTTKVSVIVGLSSVVGTALVSATVGWFVVHQLGAVTKGQVTPALRPHTATGHTTPRHRLEAASVALSTARK